MKNRFFACLFVVASIVCGLSACQKGPSGSNDPVKNALTIQSPENARMVCNPIGSVFQGGSVLDSEEGILSSGIRYEFYREEYNEFPKDGGNPMIEVRGVMHKNEQYTVPGQWITTIYLNGLDEALGLGSRVLIQMEQGKYKGGNEAIKDVQIQSYRTPDFNMVIETTAGHVITILYDGRVLHDPRI